MSQAKEYPNYRVCVEAIIVKDNKVLLSKRSDNCTVAPNKWCVPSGKVKYEEIPLIACVREVKEETQLDVKILSEIGVRAFRGFNSTGEITYRLVYTYLVDIIGDRKDPIINEEHSEFCWVSKDELGNYEFSLANENLKKNIREILN